MRPNSLGKYGIAAIVVSALLILGFALGVRHGLLENGVLPRDCSLVEAQGGRLWVESESGVGTTFRVILPVHTPSNVHPGLLPTATETSGNE